MSHRVLGCILGVVLIGCGGEGEPQEIVEEHPEVGVSQSGLFRDQSSPNICFGSCPRIPDYEPLGQICWLDRQACISGILTCYYHCEPVEPSVSFALSR